MLISPFVSNDQSALESRVVPKQESVAAQLRDRILSGRYPAGHHLMEVPIALELGMSRTPVRDALTLLSQEGLLEPGPKRGFKVRTFTLEEILHAYDVRATLEGMACRLAAEIGINQAVIETIARCLDAGDRMLAEGPFTENQHRPWLEMNNLFHTTIVDAAANPLLCGFVEQCQKVPLASARHVHWYRVDLDNFDLARRAHQDHHEVFDAVCKRQGTRAEARMREHIYFSRQLVATQFEKVGPSIGFDADLSKDRAPDGNAHR